MQRKQHLRMCFITVLFASSMVACGNSGSSHGPVAMKIVTPEPDSSLAHSIPEDMKPMTLLEAAVFQGVPQDVAAEAMAKYDVFRDRIQKHQYITMIDFTQHSGRMRFFMVDTKTGKVDAIPVAHGTGSDPDNNGLAQYFSNRPKSKMSSLGAFLVNERFQSSEHGTALRMDGLEAINDNVRARGVIVHSARYVKDGKSQQGLSWGCPAVPLDWIRRVLDRLSDGTFLYAYGHSQAKSVFDELFNVDADGVMINPAYQWMDEGASAPVGGE